MIPGWSCPRPRIKSEGMLVAGIDVLQDRRIKTWMAGTSTPSDLIRGSGHDEPVGWSASRMARLNGRVAIVTGGAVGIGRHYSQALAAESARVVIAHIVGGAELAGELAAEPGA